MKCRLAANSTAVNTSIINTDRYGAPADNQGSDASKAAIAKPTTRSFRSAGRNGDSAGPATRIAVCGLPSKPDGRSTSTMAITTNSTTRVSFENANDTPNTSTVPIATHTALISAINSAARNAPGIEPIPPTTTTTNASPMVSKSSPRLAGSRGNCVAPPKPASRQPNANTEVNNHA